MKTPEDVEVMLRLRAQGWGSKRIAQALGISRNTVRNYLRAGQWTPYGDPSREASLDGLDDWLEQRFVAHDGNAAVIHQELRGEHSIEVSLRTVQRAVTELRQARRAAAVATVRFETAPGEQMQIDFGTRNVSIGGEGVRVRLFVATLSYSRRIFVQASTHERQAAWLSGIEAAFRHFGGVPRKLLLDNARALVKHHDPMREHVVFTDSFEAFCRHWDVSPRACKPYRARTKGKDERAVGYVKRNAIAGREFDSWSHLEQHLTAWMREVADVRIHGTTGERPTERFLRDEAQALRGLDGRAPFIQQREYWRVVHSDACVLLDTNAYSVPWALIGYRVLVCVHQGRVRILDGDQVVAEHLELRGQRQRRVERAHLAGIVGGPAAPRPEREAKAVTTPPQPDLLRPLSEYEAIVGGGW